MQAVGFLMTFAVTIGTMYWKWGGAIGKVRDDLAAHKLHVAETYATKAGMQEQTAQLLRAIEGVGNRIDGLHERLDRAFEQSPRRS